MPHIELLTHRGHRVLHADLRGLRDDSDLRLAADAVSAAIRQEPPESALVLVDVTGFRYGLRAIRLLSEQAAENAPFVRARAIVGLPRVAWTVLHEVSLFTKRPAEAFESREEALDWLVGQAAP